MKYWRGYIAAAIIAALTWALTAFCQKYSVLVDMIYPYFSRFILTSLAQWSSGVSFCLWQVLAVLLVVILLATIVLMIIFKWNPIQWFGWVLTAASFLWLLHTGIYGLSNYAGSLADDIRLNVKTGYSVSQLAEATAYYRDKANELADSLPLGNMGERNYPTFEEMTEQAGAGFTSLVRDYSYPVFSGSTLPVKALAWADWYTSMGITGVTMPLTGEAAVNTQTPAISLPFTICHEMAHRMCIPQERDANLAAFLACQANPDPFFQYSGYYMAFRYCYSALTSVNTSAAKKAAAEIYAGCSSTLKSDLSFYDVYYSEKIDEVASEVADAVNDSYIKVSGDESGVQSYGDVCDLLVSWYIQEIYLPQHQEEEQQFDPLDKSQVFPDGW